MKPPRYQTGVRVAGRFQASTGRLLPWLTAKTGELMSVTTVVPVPSVIPVSAVIIVTAPVVSIITIAATAI